MIRVEAVLFNLFPALVGSALALLAFPPEEDAAQYKQCNDDDGNDDSNGRLTTGAQAA